MKIRGISVARGTEAGHFVESKRKSITTILTWFQRVTWHLTAIFPKIEKQKDDTGIKRPANFIREMEMSSRTISIVKRFSSKNSTSLSTHNNGTRGFRLLILRNQSLGDKFSMLG